MKKLISLLIAAVLAMSMPVLALADNGNVTRGADSEEKTMVTVVGSALETLDPFYPNGGMTQRLNTCMWDTLWDMEYGGSEEVGLCAKEWTFSDDETTVYVTLYDNIHDSDGNPINAHDFEWFYNKFLETNVLANIISFTATGDYELEIEMRDPYYPGYLYFSTQNIVAVAETAYDPDLFRESPVTSGQYKPYSFTSGANTTLIQTYDYWGDPDRLTAHRAANVDVIRFEVITENSQIETALKANSVQAGDITASIAEDFEGTDVQVGYFDAAYPQALILNCYEDSPFADNKALREAVAYAIDYDSICQVVTLGNGTVTGALGNPSLAGYSEDFAQYGYEHDPEKAKEKLAEAGYSEGELTLTYMTEDDNEVGLVLQASLAEVGINLEIALLEETAFLSERSEANQNDWQIYINGFVPMGYMTTMMYQMTEMNTLSYGNYAGTEDQELADAVVTARYSQSPEDIDSAYAMLMDRLYYLPLYNDYSYDGYYSKIDSLVKNSTSELCAQASIFADDYDIFWDGN